jgi:NCAIR mutase (PurE)-related protein
MDNGDVEKLATKLLSGTLSIEQFVSQVTRPKSAPTHDATVDLDRRRRCGLPEVVFGQGKTAASIVAIFRELLADGADALATRVDAEQARELSLQFPEGAYNEIGRTFCVKADSGNGAEKTTQGHVAVVTAGTSDRPVAEEACETLRWMGVEVTLIQDVGVAGPHRLEPHVERLRACDAVIVIAGMEGALPSVVGGHLACPVIAVPTSVGYGMSLGGIAALLGMLNSCASNVTVVNIDAGFKAGYVAGLIARRATVGGKEDA